MAPGQRQAIIRTSAGIFIPPPNEVDWGVYWIHLVRLSVRPSVGNMISGALLKFALEFQFQILYAYCLWPWAEAYWFSVMSLSKWPPGGHLGFFGFRTLTLVWLWRSSLNFHGTSLVYMERNLLIFSNVTFKMATWWPYWIVQFPYSNFNLALNFKSKLQ